MGTSRELFEKIRDTKPIFHAKMDTTKNRNGKDLIEAEEIKKRRQEYTEKKKYKKGLNDPECHNGVATHLESHILECEVKQTLGSITMKKASGGDEITVSYFKS